MSEAFVIISWDTTERRFRCFHWCLGAEQIRRSQKWSYITGMVWNVSISIAARLRGVVSKFIPFNLKLRPLEPAPWTRVRSSGRYLQSYIVHIRMIYNLWNARKYVTKYTYWKFTRYFFRHDTVIVAIDVILAGWGRDKDIHHHLSSNLWPSLWSLPYDNIQRHC